MNYKAIAEMRLQQVLALQILINTIGNFET